MKVCTYFKKNPGNQASIRQASLRKSCSREACDPDLPTLGTGSFSEFSPHLIQQHCWSKPGLRWFKGQMQNKWTQAQRKCWELADSVSVPGLFKNTWNEHCIKQKQTAWRVPWPLNKLQQNTLLHSSSKQEQMVPVCGLWHQGCLAALCACFLEGRQLIYQRSSLMKASNTLIPIERGAAGQADSMLGILT